MKNVTVSHSCGQWFVSIQTEREIEQPIPQGGAGAVGIDMAWSALSRLGRHRSTRRLTASSGMKPPCAAQQALSRKTKFSNNWKKAARVQRIHSVSAMPAATTPHIVLHHDQPNHAMVYRGLAGANMSKSAAGTADAPEETFSWVGLNKSILDQAGLEFRAN